MSRIGKTLETKNRLVVARACKKWGWGMGTWFLFFGGIKNVLKLIVVKSAQLYDILKTTEYTLKMVNLCHVNYVPIKMLKIFPAGSGFWFSILSLFTMLPPFWTKFS